MEGVAIISIVKLSQVITFKWHMIHPGMEDIAIISTVKQSGNPLSNASHFTSKMMATAYVDVQKCIEVKIRHMNVMY